MSKRAPRESALIRTIGNLAPDKAAEDRQLPQTAAKLAEKAFRRVWDNPADAAYDRRL